jgi:enterochelin esterase family protein
VLRDEGRIPFAEGDSVAFLWRGSTTSIAVVGDHTRWNPTGNGMARVGLSDVWMRIYALPEAARVDYKFVLNGSNWILDPNNPHQQWSGFGPNSELRMPAWVFPDETVRDPAALPGTLSADLLIQSDTLGQPVRYRVFTPAGYDGLSDLPVVYVTDGHEYSDDRLGAVRIVADNLIHDGRSAPAIVVFIDPRHPTTGQNQRQDHYVQNPAFAHFVARELVPSIDAAYRTNTDPDSRVILGTSLGGVFSVYLGLLHPDVFGRLAAQSPAFWVTESPDWWTGPSLFEMVASGPAGAFEIYLSTGTIHDGHLDARRMRDAMITRAHGVTYREVPEGHSWGNWRALIDEVLMALTPGPAASSDPPERTGSLRLDAIPNPAAGDVQLRFTMMQSGPANLDCFDLQGRLLVQVVADTLVAGEHARSASFRESGHYVCRLTTASDSVSQFITVSR